MTTQEKQELKNLLFKESNHHGEGGILTMAKNTFISDSEKAKLHRISELLAKI